LPQKAKKSKGDPKARGDRLQIVSHNGAQIAIADYSHGNREEIWALTDQVNQWLGKQKPDSVRLLFDVKNVYYEAAHVNHWKKSLGNYDAVIRKSAFINASPLMLLIVKTMRAYSLFAGIPMKKDRGVFLPDKDKALDWLAEG
jgi:hypothetical protein